MAKKNQLYFRRCHQCSRTNMHSQMIERCGFCGKALARYFYFDEKYVSAESDSDERPPLLPGELRPLRGLSAWWSEWSEEIE